MVAVILTMIMKEAAEVLMAERNGEGDIEEEVEHAVVTTTDLDFEIQSLVYQTRVGEEEGEVCRLVALPKGSLFPRFDFHSVFGFLIPELFYFVCRYKYNSVMSCFKCYTTIMVSNN